MVNKVGVSLGNSMFMDWEQIDAALNRWAKEYFGEHVESVGNRDENEFEISLGGLTSDEYEKYVRIFEVFDEVKDYEPEDEETFDDYGVVLPAEITKRLMVNILGDNGLKSYGTALATYDGVFFMEQDRHAQKELDRVVEVAEHPERKVEPKLEVGMVGTIKDELGVKEKFRGKDFKILAVGATKEDEFAVCLVDGRDDIVVWRQNMDSVRMPEASLENTLADASRRSFEGIRGSGLETRDSIAK